MIAEGVSVRRLLLVLMAAVTVGTVVLPAGASAEPFCSGNWRDLSESGWGTGFGESGPIPVSTDVACASASKAIKASEDRLRWLHSPGVRAERVSSRMAFHGLGVGASQLLLARDYGSVLAGVSANPAASVARMGSVVRYLSDYRALVRTPHGLQVETSTVPLRVADGTGGKRPVDLRMAASSGAFTPARPLTSMSIARDSSSGVEVGPDGLRIALQGADALGISSGGQRIFFPGVDRDMDAVVAPKLHGAELFAVLRSRLSPQQIRYRLALPAGAGLQAVAGGAVISRGGTTLAHVPAPSARDAQGSYVPVQMRVVGDELLLEVTHRERDVAYPVLVDPEIITITEKAVGWEFKKEPLCGEEKHEQPPIYGTAPGGGSPMSIYSPETAYPYVWRSPCAGKAASASIKGFWRWEVPSMTKPPITAEFDGISLAYHVTGEAREESEVVYPTFGICNEGFPGVPVQPIIVGEVKECPVGQNYIRVELAVGRIKGIEPVTVSASVSVEAILLSSPWPIPEKPETYGPVNPGEPNRAKCMLGYPVDCATGNQVETQTDLTVGGRGSGLRLTRTYNLSLPWSRVNTKNMVPSGMGGRDSIAHISRSVKSVTKQPVHQQLRFIRITEAR